MAFLQSFQAPNTEDIDAFQTIFRHEIEKIQKKLQTFAKILRQLEVSLLIKNVSTSHRSFLNTSLILEIQNVLLELFILMLELQLSS